MRISDWRSDVGSSDLLASLSPFVLYAAGRRFGSVGWIVAAALVGIVVLLGGARASWVTYALVLVFSGWRLLGWKTLLGMFAFGGILRSEEHTSELQSLMRISYAVFCLKTKKKQKMT